MAWHTINDIHDQYSEVEPVIGSSGGGGAGAVSELVGGGSCFLFVTQLHSHTFTCDP